MKTLVSCLFAYVFLLTYPAKAQTIYDGLKDKENWLYQAKSEADTALILFWIKKQRSFRRKALIAGVGFGLAGAIAGPFRNSRNPDDDIIPPLLGLSSIGLGLVALGEVSTYSNRKLEQHLSGEILAPARITQKALRWYHRR
ncbi:MAG: hypothetical protein AAF804_10600 [Bacteroidota bacterium]